MSDIKQLAGTIVEATRAAIERALQPMRDELAALKAMTLPEDRLLLILREELDEAFNEHVATSDEKVAAAVAALPKAKDGKDATVDMAGLELVCREAAAAYVAAAFEAYPKPTVDMLAVHALVRDLFAAWPKPRDGRDALDPEQITLAVEAAAVRMWKSPEVQIEQQADYRSVALTVIVGQTKTTTMLHFPVPLYRGVWRERDDATGDYEIGDEVTYRGSMWHCNEPTRTKPETDEGAKAWTLCVKRGVDGRDMTERAAAAAQSHTVLRLR
jgi:hypothetical protein